MAFVILKSYDGGKSWERERRCPDFGAAADAAQTLRVQLRSIRFRVDVETAPRPSPAREPGAAPRLERRRSLRSP